MTDEARAKIKAITDQLEQGITDLYNSGKYAAYLAAMAKFHDYSAGNVILILKQRPDASRVAGYNAWKSKHKRYVKRGESGITILAPCPYEREETIIKDGQEETKIRSGVFFRAATVFDVSQTDGEPLPEIVTELDSKVGGYERMIAAMEAVSPVPVRYGDTGGASRGYYSRGASIVVKAGMPELQTLKTLIHEIAHAKLHSDKAGVKGYAAAEVEAESVAYVVCSRYGLPADDYSFGYIAGWSGGKNTETLKASLDIIRNTAHEIITAVDGYLPVHGGVN